jgi:hypothetical protein
MKSKIAVRSPARVGQAWRSSRSHFQGQAARPPRSRSTAAGRGAGWPRPNAGANAEPHPYPAPPPAESERTRSALREPVVLAGVRRGLHLRHVLALCLVEVIEATRRAGRVRVVQRPSFIGVVHHAWRTLDLTGKSTGRSSNDEHSNTSRDHDESLQLRHRPQAWEAPSGRPLSGDNAAQRLRH